MQPFPRLVQGFSGCLFLCSVCCTAVNGMMSPDNLGFVSVKIIVLTFISLMLCFEEPLANPSETANERMSCTVRSNKVINITEGKSTEYSGFKNGVEIGDAFKFEYGACIDGKIAWGYTCELKDEVRDYSYIIGYNLQYGDIISSSDKISVKTDRLVFWLNITNK